MNNAMLTIMLNRIFYPTFLLLSCLFIAENLYSRKHWNREDYIMAYYNDVDNAIEMRFQFYDPKFGPSNEDGYLEECYFHASIDGETWYFLMKASTHEQSTGGSWFYLYLMKTNPSIFLQFKFTAYPLHDDYYNKFVENQRVVVFNGEKFKKINEYPLLAETYCVIKWHLAEKFKNMRYIRVKGKWHSNGAWRNESFEDIVYDTHNPFGLPLINDPKTPSSKIIDHPTEYGNNPTEDNINEDNTNSVKVLADIDGVMIAGAEVGEKVTVYSTSGVHIKSIVINGDIVKIDLPQSQVYIVHVGQKRHKVAL